LSAREHGWEVAGTELPWSRGFIDLVLQRGRLLLVIECKRVEDGTWIFLVRRGKQPTERFRMPWWNGRAPDLPPTERQQSVTKVFCDELFFDPPSPESEYCSVPKKKGPITSFEPLAQEIVSAAQDMAAREDVAHRNDAEFYIPAIVTNARLVTCELDPSTVSLDSGQLSAASWSDQAVVRFRKTLTLSRSNDYNSDPVDRATWQTDRTRTVLVVSAAALQTVLNGLRKFRYDDFNQAPPAWSNPRLLVRGKGA